MSGACVHKWFVLFVAGVGPAQCADVLVAASEHVHT